MYRKNKLNGAREQAGRLITLKYFPRKPGVLGVVLHVVQQYDYKNQSHLQE